MVPLRLINVLLNLYGTENNLYFMREKQAALSVFLFAKIYLDRRGIIMYAVSQEKGGDTLRPLHQILYAGIQRQLSCHIFWSRTAMAIRSIRTL